MVSKTNFTRENLIAAFDKIGYKVTRQSTDGNWMLLRYPDGTSTGYWLFDDHIAHRLEDSRGGSHFGYRDCNLVVDDETVALVAKKSLRSDVFVQFHNFEAHKIQAHPNTKENI